MEEKGIENTKKIIEKLYDRYLSTADKVKKIEKVKAVKERLVKAGVLNKEAQAQTIDYDIFKAVASDYFEDSSVFDSEIYNKIKEIRYYLGATKMQLEIITPKADIQYNDDSAQRVDFTERAQQLGLKYRCFDEWPGSGCEAVLELYADADVSAFVFFSKHLCLEDDDDDDC